MEEGVVSALGNVLEGNCRATILFKHKLPFKARKREDIDTKEKELAFLLCTAVKSDRHELEKAMLTLDWLEASGSKQKDAVGKFGFANEIAVCRALAPLKVPSGILDAYRA